MSNVLGMLVILGSLTVKAPIMLNLIRNKSAKGLSIEALYSEALGLTLTSSYHFLHHNPFTAWAENLSVLIQVLILVFMVWFYNEAKVSQVVGPIGISLSIIIFVLNVLDPYYWWTLSIGATIVGMGALIPQIITNSSLGHTGPLSIITSSLNVAGICTRIFTTVHQMNDPLTLGGLGISLLLQLLLMMQILTMKNATNAAMKSEKKL